MWPTCAQTGYTTRAVLGPPRIGVVIKVCAKWPHNIWRFGALHIGGYFKNVARRLNNPCCLALPRIGHEIKAPAP